MDVPISVGILLATAMSLSETIRGGEHAYFDSAVMLLFFLLVGRYLDRRARGRARSAAERLLALRTERRDRARPATADGSRLPASEVAPGMMVLAGTGERIGVDGRVLAGPSEVDTSLITGETLPRAVRAGDQVFAGTLNLGAPLRLEVTRDRRAHAARRDRAPDGARRAAPGALRRARRPGRAPLRAGGARAGARDLPRLDAAGRDRLADGAALCRGGPDHHLPLRARPRGAGGAGDRERPSPAPRRPAQVRDRARAPRAGRHGGLRQDRDPDPRPARRSIAPKPSTRRRCAPRPRSPAPAAIRSPAR